MIEEFLFEEESGVDAFFRYTEGENVTSTEESKWEVLHPFQNIRSYRLVLSQTFLKFGQLIRKIASIHL